MPSMRGLLRKFDIDAAKWQHDDANGILLVQPRAVRRIEDDEHAHDDCEYFIIDLYHDPFAAAALRAYAAACARSHPKMAQDLMRLAPLTGKEDT